jgi:hypothetical protein
MVPIEQVFDNMSKGHATTLYTHSEIQKWRIAKEKDIRKSGSKSGHSEADLDCLLKPSREITSEMHNINVANGDGGTDSSPQEIKPESDDHPEDGLLNENEKTVHDPGMDIASLVKVYPTKFYHVKRIMTLFALGLSMFLVGSVP